jgi:hypothetical protein
MKPFLTSMRAAADIIAESAERGQDRSRGSNGRPMVKGRRDSCRLSVRRPWAEWLCAVRSEERRLVNDYIEQLKDIPVMPEVAAKVARLTEDRLEISFRELETIIKTDPGLTAKILKIANSALYARQREIKSLQMAITLLGFKNIKSLVLLITASGFFPRMRRALSWRVRS